MANMAGGSFPVDEDLSQPSAGDQSTPLSSSTSTLQADNHISRKSTHDLKSILVDFQWIRKYARASEHGILDLVKHGYDRLLAAKPQALNMFEREGYRLIRNALMLIRPVLQPGIPAAEMAKGLQTETAHTDQSSCAHLATQLYGRLLDASRRFSVVASLLESIRIHAKRPWLRPLNPCFESPKADVIAVRSGVDAVSSAIAMSHDGQLVLTAGDNHTLSAHVASSWSGGFSAGAMTANYYVRIWHVATGKCVSTIRGLHTSSVLSLAITRDKKNVISCAGSQLMFWNIMDDKGNFITEVTQSVQPEQQGRMVFSVAVLPDSECIIAAHQNGIKIWNVVTGKCEGEFEKTASMIYSLDVTPDGKYLVSGEQGGFIWIWNVGTRKKVLHFDNRGCSVFSVAFMVQQEAGSGTEAPLKVVSGSTNSKLSVWTVPPMQPESKPYCCDSPPENLTIPGADVTINSIRCSGSGAMFTGSDDGVVRMWKEHNNSWASTTLSQDSRARLGGKPSVFVAASGDGSLVASSSKPLIPVFDIGQYEKTLRAQKGVLDQPYFPYQRESQSFTDMEADKKLANSNLPRNLGEYFLVGGTDSYIRHVKPLELSTPGNLLEVILFNTNARLIAFDENIEARRSGIFISQDANPTRRLGVAVAFKEGGLAFFEVELDPDN